MNRIEAGAKALWDANHHMPYDAARSAHTLTYRLQAKTVVDAADAAMLSDEAVERAAQVSWDAIIDGASPWSELDDETKRLHTETTRAVIAALKGDA